VDSRREALWLQGCDTATLPERERLVLEATLAVLEANSDVTRLTAALSTDAMADLKPKNIQFNVRLREFTNNPQR
jgi:hypothetical protein